MRTVSVNLPRWGLKRFLDKEALQRPYQCKFTPLGFETINSQNLWRNRRCVNLPRWGLKHEYEHLCAECLKV